MEAYYGSVEGCYVIINLLFVHPHPSALLTQIVSNLGEDKKESEPGKLLGLELQGPSLEDFKKSHSPSLANCMFQLEVEKLSPSSLDAWLVLVFVEPCTGDKVLFKSYARPLWPP